VGESGCGKSTLGYLVIRLLNPTSGQIFFDGEDFLALRDEDLRRKRRAMQIIFQDSFASLDPRMTIGDIIGEPLDIQRACASRSERQERILELMGLCGLESAYIRRYAHEFSGGQRQRIGIARALALSPSLVVCDEPVSALDVSIQAQILNLLMELKERLGLSYLFISHDLGVVKYVSDYVAVLYLGKIVEIAPRDDIYENARHPYTKALLSAIPIADTRVKRERLRLTGSIPSPINLPSGCSFHTRCPMADERCRNEAPPSEERTPGHFVACFHAE